MGKLGSYYSIAVMLSYDFKGVSINRHGVNVPKYSYRVDKYIIN